MRETRFLYFAQFFEGLTPRENRNEVIHTYNIQYTYICTYSYVYILSKCCILPESSLFSPKYRALHILLISLRSKFIWSSLLFLNVKLARTTIVHRKNTEKESVQYRIPISYEYQKGRGVRFPTKVISHYIQYKLLPCIVQLTVYR